MLPRPQLPPQGDFATEYDRVDPDIGPAAWYSREDAQEVRDFLKLKPMREIIGVETDEVIEP
jgi:hypothetical protein